MMSDARNVLSGVTPTPTMSKAVGDLSISIVIPHFQDLENLDLCLALLGRQTIDPARCQIIVADNASPIGLDAVRAVVGDRGQMVLSTRKGAGVTRNVGVEAATGDILAFIDSDCRPDSTYLERGLEKLSTYDIVGGHVRVDVKRPGEPTSAEAFEMVFAFRNERYIKDKSFTVTASLFVSRAIFDVVGPFVNDVSEDMEWCHRAVGLGYSLGYAADAVIGHPARYDWKELARKWRRLTAEGYGINKTKKLAMLKWISYNWFVLAATLPQCAKIIRSRRLAGASQRLGAVGIFFRIRLMRFIWAHEAVWKDLSCKFGKN